MADVQLDPVSTTMDDNSPLDYAAIMRDIDKLDQILAGIEHANHTDTRDNVHATDSRVCSGQLCTSTYRCTCHTCTNCASICTRCHSLQRSVACQPHLPPACFTPDNPLCQACCNKQESHPSERNIVTEVTILTVRATQSFAAFVTHDAGVINNIIDDNRCQYRSIRVHCRGNIFVRHAEDGQQQRVCAYSALPSTMSTTRTTSASSPLPLTSPARSSIGMSAAVGSSWIALPNSLASFSSTAHSKARPGWRLQSG